MVDICSTIALSIFCRIQKNHTQQHLELEATDHLVYITPRLVKSEETEMTNVNGKDRSDGLGGHPHMSPSLAIVFVLKWLQLHHRPTLTSSTLSC